MSSASPRRAVGQRALPSCSDRDQPSPTRARPRARVSAPTTALHEDGTPDVHPDDAQHADVAGEHEGHPDDISDLSQQYLPGTGTLKWVWSGTEIAHILGYPGHKALSRVFNTVEAVVPLHLDFTSAASAEPGLSPPGSPASACWPAVQELIMKQPEGWQPFLPGAEFHFATHLEHQWRAAITESSEHAREGWDAPHRWKPETLRKRRALCVKILEILSKSSPRVPVKVLALLHCAFLRRGLLGRELCPITASL
jgi:hypothetical protein